MLLQTSDRHQNKIIHSNFIAEHCKGYWEWFHMCKHPEFEYLPLQAGAVSTCFSHVKRILVCYRKSCSCNNIKIFAYGQNRNVSHKMDWILPPNLCSLPLHTAGATFSENKNSHHSLGALQISAMKRWGHPSLDQKPSLLST